MKLSSSQLFVRVSLANTLKGRGRTAATVVKHLPRCFNILCDVKLVKSH